MMEQDSKKLIVFCQVCNRQFHRKEHLKRHMVTHSGEKPYSCTQCDLKVSRQEHLKRHMKIHSGEKPYMCEYCGRRHPLNYELNRHIKNAHKDDKSYKCFECKTVLSNSTDLFEHMKECMPYDPSNPNMGSKYGQKGSDGKVTCKICSKSFSWSYFRQHIKRHRLKEKTEKKDGEKEKKVRRTKREIHKCPVCDQKLKSAGNLHKHLERIHFAACTMTDPNIPDDTEEEPEVKEKIEIKVETNATESNVNDTKEYIAPILE